MKTNLHSIELEQNGNIFAIFRNETEYDEYLGDLAVDYYDGDVDMSENYDVWYCVFINDELVSMTQNEYHNLVKDLIV